MRRTLTTGLMPLGQSRVTVRRGSNRRPQPDGHVNSFVVHYAQDERQRLL